MMSNFAILSSVIADFFHISNTCAGNAESLPMIQVFHYLSILERHVAVQFWLCMIGGIQNFHSIYAEIWMGSNFSILSSVIADFFSSFKSLYWWHWLFTHVPSFGLSLNPWGTLQCPVLALYDLSRSKILLHSTSIVPSAQLNPIKSITLQLSPQLLMTSFHLWNTCTEKADSSLTLQALSLEAHCNPLCLLYETQAQNISWAINHHHSVSHSWVCLLICDRM